MNDIFLGHFVIFSIFVQKFSFKNQKQWIVQNVKSATMLEMENYVDCSAILVLRIYALWVRSTSKCKRCFYRYTVERKSDVKTKETRRLALEMYLEGLGFRAIGRILRISYGTVYVWVKEWGSKVSLPRRETPVRIVELDEMHTYVGQKKTTAGYACTSCIAQVDYC